MSAFLRRSTSVAKGTTTGLDLPNEKVIDVTLAIGAESFKSSEIREPVIKSNGRKDKNVNSYKNYVHVDFPFYYHIKYEVQKLLYINIYTLIRTHKYLHIYIFRNLIP